MNVGGGEAADQMVRMMLSGGEVAVRLSGSAIKNMLAMTMALAHGHRTLSGKVNMGKMLRETRDLRRFPMIRRQYKQFRKSARKYKLLYSVIRDKGGRGKLMDVILPVTELGRANAIFERILYTLPAEPEREPERPLQKGYQVFQRSRQVQEKEQQAPEQADEASSRRQQGPQVPNKEQARQDGPAAKPREDTPKKGPRSERGSPDTKANSSAPRGSGPARTTRDRPSVERRLKLYKVQLEKASAPAKQRTKVKARPKTR